jgi:hypothetical protein
MRAARCLGVCALLLGLLGSEAMAQFPGRAPGQVPAYPVAKRYRKYMGSPPMPRKRRRHRRPRILTPAPAAPVRPF